MKTLTYVLTVDTPGESRTVLGVSPDAGTMMLRAETCYADMQMSAARTRLSWEPADSPFSFACWEAFVSDGEETTFRVERFSVED